MTTMNGAVMTLSEISAREAIKRELNAQGLKLAHVEACEITSQPMPTSRITLRS